MTPCELCGGACCKSFLLPAEMFKDKDSNDWLRFHADETGKSSLRFDKPCRMLKAGRCTIYESRPQICKDYYVGSPGCMAAMKRFIPHKMKAVVKLIQQSAQKPSQMEQQQ